MFNQQDLSFIHKYFVAEKQESLLFLVIGILALLVSGSFFFLVKTNAQFFKGAAIPLVAIGLIQLIVGYTVYARSDKQRIEVTYKMGIEPSFVKHQELPRMETVNRNFVIYRWIEIALLLAGLVLIILFWSIPARAFWFGLGLTLAIQSALMLGADYFAEKRALNYTKELMRMQNN